jgi:enolase-phosphatase E1
LHDIAVLTDIEGTTTDIAFVHTVLFPYSHEHFPQFLHQHAGDPEVRDALAEIRVLENNPGLTVEEIIPILLRWIGEDRKAKPLKTLQGLIWRQGYDDGALTSHVYADALEALQRWHKSGIPLYVYSSGSIAAQKLLFAHTDIGDLTPLFSGYYDTGTGPKLESKSYAKIASALNRPPRSMLFLSDHAGETNAAASAGLRAVRVDRARAMDLPPSSDESVPVVSGFHQVDPKNESGVVGAPLSRRALS